MQTKACEVWANFSPCKGESVRITSKTFWHIPVPKNILPATNRTWEGKAIKQSMYHAHPTDDTGPPEIYQPGYSQGARHVSLAMQVPMPTSNHPTKTTSKNIQEKVNHTRQEFLHHYKIPSSSLFLSPLSFLFTVLFSNGVAKKKLFSYKKQCLRG